MKYSVIVFRYHLWPIVEDKQMYIPDIGFRTLTREVSRLEFIKLDEYHFHSQSNKDAMKQVNIYWKDLRDLKLRGFHLELKVFRNTWEFIYHIFDNKVLLNEIETEA